MEKSLFTDEYRVLICLLREVRKQGHITQTQLAERLGTTQSLISKCERGERRLDAIELRRWVMGLGVAFPAFLERFESHISNKGPDNTN